MLSIIAKIFGSSKVYVDKNHRVVLTNEGWTPQWCEASGIVWRTYRFMKADTCVCSMQLYSDMGVPYFESAESACRFIEKAIKDGFEGKYYCGYDETMPDGLKM